MGEHQIHFLKKNGRSFVMLELKDVDFIPDSEIKIILPLSKEHGITKRQTALLCLEVHLSFVDIQ